MARTTSTLVGQIIKVDADIDLSPFIETANALVTECCTNSSYTNATLELIERWLAAHFYTIRDMRMESERLGAATEKRQSKVDIGFNSSIYGQHAMRLDVRGNLAALDKRTKDGKKDLIAATWLGTENPNA